MDGIESFLAWLRPWQAALVALRRIEAFEHALLGTRGCALERSRHLRAGGRDPQQLAPPVVRIALAPHPSFGLEAANHRA